MKEKRLKQNAVIVRRRAATNKRQFTDNLFPLLFWRAGTRILTRDLGKCLAAKGVREAREAADLKKKLRRRCQSHEKAVSRGVSEGLEKRFRKTRS